MPYQMVETFTSGNATPAAQVARVFGFIRQVLGYTIHHWDDKSKNLTPEGVVSWLCRSEGNTSAHYVVDGPSRRVFCLVNPADAAWHSGSAQGNATTIGIELNNKEDEATYDVAAELIADLRDPNAYGDQPLYRHRDWISTACPGDYDVERIDRVSYTKVTGVAWGDVHDKAGAPRPVDPAPPVVIPPVPVTPVEAEWVRNIEDIEDVKLQVLLADGAKVFNLNTLEPLSDSIIPKGTWVDIAKETTVGGKKFYISSFAATSLKANGILASDLGIPLTPPKEEKPEWLKNLKDITDKDMWTRSTTPVLNLADGKTVRILPINTKVRVIESTTILGQNLLVLDDEKTCIETIYLSDTPLTDPMEDIKKRLSALETAISVFKALWKVIVEFVTKHKEV